MSEDSDTDTKADNEQENEPEPAIQDFVDAVNEVGEHFRVLSYGPGDDEKLVEATPYRDYIRTHEPWDRAFVVWVNDWPAYLSTNYRGRWSVTPTPDQGLAERANVYCELAGDRPLCPKLIYEPAGEKVMHIPLEPHPVPGRDDRFRMVATDKTPVPEIILQIWDLDVNDKPAVDAPRYFQRGDHVRVVDTGEEGVVKSVNGRDVVLDLPNRDEDFPSFRPAEVDFTIEPGDTVEIPNPENQIGRKGEQAHGEVQSLSLESRRAVVETADYEDQTQQFTLEELSPVER
jgi:hypothetical protein